MVAFLFHQQATTNMPKWSVLFLHAQQRRCFSESRFSFLSILLAYWLHLIMSQQTAEVCGWFCALLFLQQMFRPRGAGWRTLSSCDLECWSWLIINKTKCVECFFYSIKHFLSNPFLNGEALSREQTVKYLRVHFTPNMIWSTHIYTIFTKCLKLSFLSKGSAPWTFTSPFYCELFQPVLSL